MTNVSPNPADEPKSAAARLFDIRLLIGALFTLYGVMLTVAGFFTSDAQRAKASNININLWLGIGMLILGLLFLLWQRLNPLRIEPSADDARPPNPGGH
ncbi:MAG: hypothetical protein JWN95_2249 [Frankiales bacterium]|nr:hypothetical protein [Frankiales bacterium]